MGPAIHWRASADIPSVSNLNPDAAPRHPQYLGLLLTNPVCQSRLAPLNLRYLVAIGGATDIDTKGGAGWPFASLRVR